MENTLGQRISTLRKNKGLTQEELAHMLNVSAQAVSKWENDITCPDISLLPELAEILGVTIDELLSGKKELLPSAKILPAEERKDIKDMLLRIVIDDSEGDKVRINIPMALIQVAIETNMEMPQINGKDSLKNIDLNQILELVHQGVVGNLLEIESAEGDTVRIFVE